MKPEIRKIVTYREEVFIEGFKVAETTWILASAAAVITNPWAGRFVEDLNPEIRAFGPVLGALLTSSIASLVNDAEIEAFGKAAIVGLNGEIEHASGLIHTLRFGNHYREAVGATSYLAFTNIRGTANTQLQIPLMDKHDAGRRSHYQTIQVSIADAPRDDELVIALGAATSGRPHHRIGDRYQDLEDLGHDLDNPAGI
ncbi:MAG: amino acid synthesis family protein [Pseudomonadota bacterium]